MSVALDADVTAGSLVALRRLRDGDRLAQAVDRLVVRFRDDESLHHFTFKNLLAIGALKRVKGARGFRTWKISNRGRKILDENTGDAA